MSATTPPQVTIYTDGACDPNPGPGGWAAILVSGPHEKELTGSDPETTNNRMELQAVISALQALKQPSQVTLYTDSRYVQQGITDWLPHWQKNNWQTSTKQDVKNRDLWEALAAAIAPHTINWQWLKGHAGHPLNERADRLAVAQIPRTTPQHNHDAALYIGVSCQSPQGAGTWVVLVQIDDTLIEKSGHRKNTTANQLLLIAAFEGLRLLPFNRVVRVFSNADYLVKGATQWLPNWIKRNWRGDKPIQNLPEWQALAAQLEPRTVSFFRPTEPIDLLTQAVKRAGTLRTTPP